MKKQRRRLQTFIIDKLTNSIENARTKEVFDTNVTKITDADIKTITRKDWLFNWKTEYKDKSKEVYKLTTVNNPNIIHGLVSFQDMKDHIFMHLLESAKFNQKSNKEYSGVPGNLVAFVCKTAFEKGYQGFVAFDSKTVLVRHYQESLGATQIGKQRMYLDDVASSKLVKQYFKI